MDRGLKEAQARKAARLGCFVVDDRTPWNKNLSRPLVLKDGQRLETLSDVRGLFINHFPNLKQGAPLAHASVLLLKAAETGQRADIEAATEQIERVLRSNRIME
jgi:hypothetical protein